MTTLNQPSASADSAQTTKLKLYSNCSLMQDAAASMPLSYSTTSPSPIALFPNPFRNGVEEALVIGKDNTLNHLKRGSDGWELVAIASNVLAVVVAVVPFGDLWAFYIDAQYTLQIRVNASRPAARPRRSQISKNIHHPFSTPYKPQALQLPFPVLYCSQERKPKSQ